MKDFTDEILRYVDGLSVSAEFLNEIENNNDLMKSVTLLKNDIYIISNMKNSKLTNHAINENKSCFMIIEAIQKATIDFSYKVKQTFGFLNIEMGAQRDSDISSQKSVYLYKSIEVTILEKTILLKIKSIKNRCEIIHNDKTILNISNRKYIEVELKRGDYTIIVDKYKANIFIK